MAKHHSKEELNAKIKSIMTQNKENFQWLHTFAKSPEPKTKNKEKVIRAQSEERLVGQKSPNRGQSKNKSNRV